MAMEEEPMGQQVMKPRTSRVDAPVERMVPASAYRAAVRAFGEVAMVLSTTEDPDVMLHMIARNLSALIGSRRCAIYLRDDKTRMFHGQVLHESDPGRDGES